MEFQEEVRERLTRVEEGVIHLKDGVEEIKDTLNTYCLSQQELMVDVTDLKGTQKWVRAISKGVMFSIIGAAATFIGKLLLPIKEILK